ncbi:MAG: NADAR family protein [Clostridia bacterium]|nr:NADAR family protein [Clostridia bacterium]
MIKLDQYRDTWLSEKMNDIIGFYPREFYCLDNFSSFKVLYKGVLYSSVEEAYQTLGFVESCPEVAIKIKNSYSAHEAQKIAYINKDKRQKDWDNIKVSVMEELLRAKIQQNPYVKKKLLETKDYIIVEDSPKDSFWGWGKDRNGENNLGKLWMKLRDEIRKQQY